MNKKLPTLKREARKIAKNVFQNTNERDIFCNKIEELKTVEELGFFLLKTEQLGIFTTIFEFNDGINIYASYSKKSKRKNQVLEFIMLISGMNLLHVLKDSSMLGLVEGISKVNCNTLKENQRQIQKIKAKLYSLYFENKSYFVTEDVVESLYKELALYY